MNKKIFKKVKRSASEVRGFWYNNLPNEIRYI